MRTDRPTTSRRDETSTPGGASNGVLTGHLVVEMSAFVAAPYAGLVLSHLGAEVIRIDPVVGPLDEHRWPVSADGISLFWTGLNSGKRSMRLDIGNSRGRELLIDLLNVKSGRTTLVTNLPVLQRLGGPEQMRHAAAKLLIVEMMGNFDGTSEVDYTVQPATGLPWVNGLPTANLPLNSPLPAWDLMLGLYGVIAVLDGVHRRERTGRGEHLSVALSDVAFHAVASLGRVAGAELGMDVGERAANDLLGGFGQAFRCADGRHVMVVGLTERQWHSLVGVADPESRLDRLRDALGIDFTTADQRYAHREVITAVLRPWFEARDSDDAIANLREAGAACSLFRYPSEILDDWRLDPAVNDLWTIVEQPGLGPLRGAGLPIRGSGSVKSHAKATPRQAESTAEVLASLLNMTPAESERLFREGVVA